MTDRLSALLHQEVDRLDVPAPPVREALQAGRRIRRRRRLGQAAGAVSAVAAIGIGGALVAGPDSGRDIGPDTRPDPSSVTEDVGGLQPAYGSGNTLYLGDGSRRVVLDEVVQTIYLTSAGYLVRTNATGASDGGAPFHFVLVRPDASTTDLDLTLGEVVPSTDAEQPYLAYAETDEGGQVAVVVLDVTRGESVARVEVPGKMTWGGWEAPPVALDGEHVYVGTDDLTRVVDWRTGEVSTTDRVGAFPSVAGGRSVTSEGRRVAIIDVATGETILESSEGRAPAARLSPDGRYAMVFDQVREQGFDVFALDTLDHAAVDGQPYAFGWTSDGGVFSVSGKGLEECSAKTGECTTTPLAEGVELGDFVRLGGIAYES